MQQAVQASLEMPYILLMYGNARNHERRTSVVDARLVKVEQVHFDLLGKKGSSWASEGMDREAV